MGIVFPLQKTAVGMFYNKEKGKRLIYAKVETFRVIGSMMLAKGVTIWVGGNPIVFGGVQVLYLSYDSLAFFLFMLSRMNLLLSSSQFIF